MNTIAVTNQNFTIAETVINQIDGFFSLNDLSCITSVFAYF